MNSFRIPGTDISLRLTLGGQIKLKRKYNESILSTIFRGIDDPEVVLDILAESLNFKGNTNAVTSPEDVYDAIVDAGFSGPAGIAEILAGVACVSGLIDDAMRVKIVQFAKGAISELFDDNPPVNTRSEDNTDVKNG